MKGGGAKPMVFHSSRSTPPRNSIAAVGFRRGRSSQRSCAVCFLIYVYPLDKSRLKCGIRMAPLHLFWKPKKHVGIFFFMWSGEILLRNFLPYLTFPDIPGLRWGDEESHIQQLVVKHRICQTSKKQNPVPQVSFCQQAASLSETPFARQHHRIHASLGKLWLLLGQCSPLIARRLALPERLLRSSLRQWEKDPWKRCIPCRKIMEMQSWSVGQRWSESLHRPAYDLCWLNSTYHWRTSTGQTLVFESRCCFHILCLSFGPMSQSATEPICSEHLWAIRIF